MRDVIAFCELTGSSGSTPRSSRVASPDGGGARAPTARAPSPAGAWSVSSAGARSPPRFRDARPGLRASPSPAASPAAAGPSRWSLRASPSRRPASAARADENGRSSPGDRFARARASARASLASLARRSADYAAAPALHSAAAAAGGDASVQGSRYSFDPTFGGVVSVGRFRTNADGGSAGGDVGTAKGRKPFASRPPRAPPSPARVALDPPAPPAAHRTPVVLPVLNRAPIAEDSQPRGRGPVAALAGVAGLAAKLALAAAVGAGAAAASQAAWEASRAPSSKSTVRGRRARSPRAPTRRPPRSLPAERPPPPAFPSERPPPMVSGRG